MDHVFTIRVSAEDAARLRAAAEVSGRTVPDLILAAGLWYADRLTAEVPAHSCNPVQCRWCNPLGGYLADPVRSA